VCRTHSAEERDLINLNLFQGLPSLKLTVSPPKNGGFPIGISKLPGVYFQGPTVSFSEGIWITEGFFTTCPMTDPCTYMDAIEKSVKCR